MASSPSVLADEVAETVHIQVGIRTPSMESRDIPSKQETPIYALGLPAELLINIFVHLILLYSSSPGQECERPRVPPWLAVTHVCGRWRAIALDTPDLWNVISSSWSKACVETFLERSKQAKLDITLPAGREISSHDTIKLSLPDMCMTRLRRLESSDDSFADVIKTLGSEAPHLEELALISYIIPERLPPEFLSRNIPKLKSLRLKNWTLSQWGPHILAALSHFHLCLDTWPFSSALPPLEFLQVLEGMPMLSTLQLGGSDIPLIDGGIRRVVRFSHLRSLTITDLPAQLGTSLLNALAVPPTAQVDVSVSCWLRDADTQTVHDLGVALTACCLTSPLNPFVLASPPSFKYISTDFRLDTVWTVGLAASLQPPLIEGSHPEGAHRLHFVSLFDDASHFLPTFIGSLPLEELYQLDLSGITPFASSSISPLLTHPRIETVHLTGTEIATPFLKQIANDTRLGEGSSIPFPGLKNVSIFKADFIDRTIFSSLDSFLTARMSSGVRIQKLRLVNCGISKQDEDTLTPQCQVLEVSDEGGD